MPWNVSFRMWFLGLHTGFMCEELHWLLMHKYSNCKILRFTQECFVDIAQSWDIVFWPCPFLAVDFSGLLHNGDLVVPAIPNFLTAAQKRICGWSNFLE